MQLNWATFSDDETVIRWILTLMSEGCAAVFRDEALDKASRHPEGQYCWAKLEDFQEEYKTEFMLVAEWEEAMVKLEGKSYFQKPNDSVNNYINWFKVLVRHAGIVDKGTIVLKFH